MVDLVNTPDEGSAAEVTTPDDNTPEHLRGKAPAELVDMYRSLERKLGEQSEELGSLRKLADQTLMPAQQESQAGEDIDFFTDPEKAVERIIERKLRPFDDMTREQSKTATVNRLNNDFPKWEETVKSQDFQEWVGKSKVRTKLFIAADAADFESAAELLSTWADLGNSKATTNSIEKKAVERDRKLRAVATEKGASGIDPRKILSRADLRSLRQTNPSRYNELLPDIRKAYAEGRVRA